MEMIGKGVKMVDGKNVNKGAVWVAMRVPEGYIGMHANQARITTFPLNDPENCLYSPDVISFAKEAGFYKGADKSHEPVRKLLKEIVVCFRKRRICVLAKPAFGVPSIG